MTREDFETSKANHLNEILGLPHDTDEQGLYPGEKPGDTVDNFDFINPEPF